MDPLGQIEKIEEIVRVISLDLNVLRSKLLSLKGCVRMEVNTEGDRKREQDAYYGEFLEASKGEELHLE